MAWVDMMPPRAGNTQLQNNYGVIQNQTLYSWLEQMSSNVSELLGINGWQGWSIRALGETMTVGPATASNSNTVAGAQGNIAQVATPVSFPTAGALVGYFVIPQLGTNLHIVHQASTRVGTFQAGTWPVHGIKLELLVNNQWRFNYNLAPDDAWTELSQHNTTRFSNQVFNGQAGAMTAGSYYVIPDLAPGVYRIRPTFGLATSNALPGTGTVVLTAEADGVSGGNYNHFQFKFKVGG